MTERGWWTAAILALGGFIALMLLIGNLGPAREDVDPLTVTEVLADGSPAGRVGEGEIHVVGWYAELDADCRGDEGGADADVAWLQRDCPLRVLLAEQPTEDVTQAQLVAEGIRLAAPPGSRAFPARAAPSGPNLRGQQLVFIGRFDHPTARACVPERVERCENTLVVSDYDEQVR